MRVFLELEAMIRSGNGGLQVTQEGINPGKARHIGTFALLCHNLRVMGAASRSYTTETGQSICNHCCRGGQPTECPRAISALLKDFTGAKPAARQGLPVLPASQPGRRFQSQLQICPILQ